MDLMVCIRCDMPYPLSIFEFQNYPVQAAGSTEQDIQSLFLKNIFWHFIDWFFQFN